VDRDAERTAYARAYAYLNYDRIGKWAALGAAIGTGVLYVALLGVLWLFADLMVHHGRLPAYRDLTDREQARLSETWGEGGPDRTEAVFGFRTSAPELVWRADQYAYFRDHVSGTAAAQTVPSIRDLAAPEREAALQDWAKLPNKNELLERVGLPAQTANDEVAWLLGLANRLENATPADAEAAEALRRTVQAAGGDPARVEAPALRDHGLLSLLARTYARGRFHTPLIAWLAQWNPWMWRSTTAAGLNYPHYLAGLFGLALAFLLVRALLRFLMHEAAARDVIQATTRLRRAVYHHTFRLGTLAFRELGPSEAVSIFTRHIEAVHDSLYYWLTVFFREPVKFSLLLLFALVINPGLAVAFLLFAFLVWYGGGQIATYFRRQGRIATNRAAEQLTLIRETLMLMRLVKVYLMELFNQSRIERLLARYSRAQSVRYRGEAVYQPLLVFLGGLAALILLVVAGFVVLSGQLGVASAITLATALVSLYWPVTNFQNHLKFLRRGRESAVQLFRFLDRPGEVGQVVGAEFLPPLSKKLEFDNVSLREPGTGRVLLQDVSFTVKAGQRIGLVGSEDREKHALIYLIPRLLDPTSGEIHIDQYNLRWVTLDSLRAQIGIVLQHNLVFHDTVANNIGCGDPAFTLPQIIEAAKVAHAHHFIQKMPQGYETPIGELGHPLSVSEKFRIGMARAILRDPALVVIEEPEAASDDDTKSLLDDTFARFLPGRTVLFLPHRISTIRSCDQLYLLNKGRIEATGIHRELLSQNSLYRHLHYLEFNEIAEQV
jgi:ATP-binding cassette subfamily B protein